MKILFLGDIVGESGCLAVKKYLPEKILEKEIDFVIVNGENAAKEGTGITEEITNNLFDIGIDVITTGNHVWDQKETATHIEKENRLLRPENLTQVSPGKGFGIYKTKKSWIQKVGATTGDWVSDCSECYQGELIRDHLYDMEFIVFDGEGRKLYNTSTNTYPTPENASRKDLYNIRAIDVRLTFRSKKEFFRKDAPAGKPRFVKGLGDRSRLFTDKYLRDSIVVTVHTRNLGTR